MLSIGLISLLIAVPLFSYQITPSMFNRITSILLLYAGFLSFNILYLENISEGINIYSSLFQTTNITIAIEIFLFTVGAILLPVYFSQNISTNNTINSYNAGINIGGGEYSLIILFTIIGASILISSGDIVSIFLSIELQSFAVYVLATLYRESESATAAGLKYFLLGGLSSAIILLGTGLIYYTTGLTHFESIYMLSSVNPSDINISEIEITSSYITNIRSGLTLGILLIGIGLLFKVASAPFHNWAPDVYDGTPTVVTAWLSTIPKISIFVLLLQFTVLLFNEEIWRNLLLVTSLLSLVIGTVLGLSQYKIKRLLTYSTISHVGFLLLALVINSQESVESFLFYLTQYSITNVNAFIILLAFGYLSVYSTKLYSGGSGVFPDLQLISQLKGQFNANPLLSLSFAISLFSIAGIPPLIGFFAKQIVLYSAMHAGYYFISIVAIVVSVISASYYLKIIQVMYFEAPNPQSPYVINMDGSKLNRFSDSKSKIYEGHYKFWNEFGPNKTNEYGTISNTHSVIISVLTIIITLFIMQPIILLNSCHLLALSIFYY